MTNTTKMMEIFIKINNKFIHNFINIKKIKNFKYEIVSSEPGFIFPNCQYLNLTNPLSTYFRILAILHNKRVIYIITLKLEIS
jgi:hypothetical protein